MPTDRDKISDALHALAGGNDFHPPEPKVLPAQSAQPDVDAPAEVHRTSVPQNRAYTSIAKKDVSKLELRRTLIPSCLVVGITFIGAVIGFFLQPSDSVLRHINSIWAIAIGIIGAVVLALGIFNMMIVRKTLQGNSNVHSNPV